MRLFITTYQKSGTHQIMPMFEPISDIEDRSRVSRVVLEPYLGSHAKYNQEGIGMTCHDLATFGDRRFGHIAYQPEYAEAIQKIPTKVLFNIRDPRDVVVAEYKNMERHYKKYGQDGHKALWDWYDNNVGKYIFDKEDTLTDLIHFASLRWPKWIGWLDYKWTMPVKYEELRLDTLNTCEKICNWLDGLCPIEPLKMAKKAKPRPKNPTFRKGIPGDWITEFENRHKQLANDILGDIILKLGYKLWEKENVNDIYNRI